MPHSSDLLYLEIGAKQEDAELCVVLMHGLGADGHDFEEVAKMLCQMAAPRRWRFVLPHAPVMRVTVNMGTAMPAWYDILALSHPREVDWDTVALSQQRIESIMAAESAPKIILAGFSQGAAMALHVGLRNQEKIAGILAMSGYLLQSDAYPTPANRSSLPISILHGNADDVVPIKAAEEALNALRIAGYTASFKSYIALAHSVSQEEVRDVFDWLKEHGS
ncbi:alpha/beta hydrolase [Haloferula chungangensis]|uniref:Alpha/beta hydrolase n=1 Tax=Haloferula chungangensis TaxID=1048331 RepID=A0ABW2L7U1_9BACT